MGILKKIAAPFKSAGKKLETRSDRRASEIVTAIADALDEADALTDLTEDAMDGIADKYVLVIPEIRIRLERKGPTS